MIVLDGEAVRSALSMTQAIDAVRSGFIALSSGLAKVPLRTAMNVGSGVNLVMPAYIDGSPISIVKVVSVQPQNQSRFLPTIMGTVLVLDSRTGEVRAMLDAETLTAIRTGAATGLATDLLARKDASILGIIGAGRQVPAQIEGVLAVRNLREIRIFGKRSGSKGALLEYVNKLSEQFNLPMKAALSSGEALEGADIVVTATNSASPVLHASELSPGTHINGIGSFSAAMQEVDASVVTLSRVFVDHRESAWAEAGDLIIPRDQGVFSESEVHAEIGEVASGLKTGREGDEEWTFFKSVGNAVQDAAVARVVMESIA